MDRSDAASIEQQRQRRRRINRIKTGIILTITIWMLVSLLAIIVLTVQCVRLNRKLNRLSTRMETLENGENIPVNSTNEPEDTQNALPDTFSYENIVTGIDTADNMAAEGDEHLVYLTFDEGPSIYTEKILDTLGAYQVKASFFVIGDESEESQAMYRRIVEEGHTLGMHSFSNRYSTVYASIDSFLEDFEKLSELLERTTGVKSQFYRFPGGSGNRVSNVSMVEFVRLLNERGIIYYDWNVSGGDAAADYSVDDIIANVTEGVSRYKTAVVLLHDEDNKSTTVEALGPLIEALQQMNAKILPIDEDTKVIQYIKADSVE